MIFIKIFIIRIYLKLIKTDYSVFLFYDIMFEDTINIGVISSMKMIVFDLDGTLLRSNKTISDRSRLC